MHSKSFKEVIRDIKEGEVWENPFAPISFIRLRADGVLDFNENEGINLNVKYSLQRKQYTFEEAFKAYEEGKEIEDYKGVKYKKIDGIDHYKFKCEKSFNAKADADDYWFSFDEIRGKWYIND